MWNFKQWLAVVVIMLAAASPFFLSKTIVANYNNDIVIDDIEGKIGKDSVEEEDKELPSVENEQKCSGSDGSRSKGVGRYGETDACQEQN